MIILNLKDGLGNQMFEYAFARALQLDTGDKKLVFNNYFFKRTPNRDYSLGHFTLNDEIKILPKWRQGIHTAWLMARLFFCYPKVFVKWMTSNQRPKEDAVVKRSARKGLYVHFNTFHYFDFDKHPRGTKYIYGNYENYRYFYHHLDVLKQELQIKTQPSEANKQMLEKIRNTEAVCVHIRRGDYMDPKWKFLRVCGFSYYQHCMDEIEKAHPNATFYIFSNNHEDIEWIKQNYPFSQKNMCYVDLDNPDYEELRLMTECKHFVISNSTFSWWAAVLSKAEDKMVCCPKPWVRSSREGDYDGLYLPDWNVVDVRTL